MASTAYTSGGSSYHSDEKKRNLQLASLLLPMDRFDVISFQDLTGPKGGEWVRIGGGSFGVVYRGEYLGTEVAIKEVLPNNTYDVEKYFERECVLMKEARHPNIVQYIGLTKSPGPEGRIYIISEFVGGNLRSYIADKNKAFGWPLRVSFATDIARAVAYLHARNCMHRDLKGENLLITANNRIKVCDFGFARIAARNDDEMRRISYCGTDGYMSPEILMGIDFSLPSDVFSLGVIFCEIISRRLVDANTFKRLVPSFGLEADEVREMASHGCPADFIQLCLDCCEVEPQNRPDMRQVIQRLRAIEADIVAKEAKKGTLTNVGSLRGSSLAAVVGQSGRSKRPKAPPRLPSFEGQVNLRRQRDASATIMEDEPMTHGREDSGSSTSSSDEEMEAALEALENVKVGGAATTAGEEARKTIKAGSTIKVSGHGNPWWSDEPADAPIPSVRDSWKKAIPGTSSDWKTPEDEGMYSTSVIRPSKIKTTGDSGSNLAKTMSRMSTASKREDGDDASASTMTVKGANHKVHPSDAGTVEELSSPGGPAAAATAAAEEPDFEQTTESYRTARSSHHNHNHQADASVAMATVASSIYEPALLYHRFTLVKSGVRKPVDGTSAMAQSWSGSFIPPQIILANALTKCHVCGKRLGLGAYMDCDDCPYKTHVACGDLAEPNCQELQIPASASRRNSNSKTNNVVEGGSGVADEPTVVYATPKQAAALSRSVAAENGAVSPPQSQGKASGGGLFGRNKNKRSSSKSPPIGVK